MRTKLEQVMLPKTTSSKNRTLYKNFKLLKVSENNKPIKTCSNNPSIQITSSPWENVKDPINKKEIQILLERLCDSPDILYKAVDAYIKNPSKNHENTSSILKKNTKFNKLFQTSQNSNKENSQQTNKQLIIKIQQKKNEYQEQYRRLLLMRKNYSLKTYLPYIKYIRQDEKTEMVNQMHRNTEII